MNVYVSHCANHADEEGRLSGGGGECPGDECPDTKSVYELWNRNILRRCLKTENNGEDATSGGRSFHTLVLETGKRRLGTAIALTL